MKDVHLSSYLRHVTFENKSLAHGLGSARSDISFLSHENANIAAENRRLAKDNRHLESELGLARRKNAELESENAALRAEIARLNCAKEISAFERMKAFFFHSK